MSAARSAARRRAGAGVIAADQATKALVRATLERPATRDAVLPGRRARQHAQHRRRVRLLRGGGGLLVALVTAVALVALLAFFVAQPRAAPLAWLPTGLLLGGAVGNLIDRARGERVTDFIELPLWPAFNVADVAITFGVLALLYVLEGGATMSE